MLDTFSFFHTSFEGWFNWHINVLSKKKSSMFDIKKKCFVSFYMSFIWNRINIAPSICKCVCANMAHIKHAVWSGYNHESKGLKKEQMDLFSLLFFLPKPLLFIVASKVSLRCGMFFVNVCGLLLIFTSSCFRAKLRLRSPWRRCCRIQEMRLTFLLV